MITLDSAMICGGGMKEHTQQARQSLPRPSPQKLERRIRYWLSCQAQTMVVDLLYLGRFEVLIYECVRDMMVLDRLLVLSSCVMVSL